MSCRYAYASILALALVLACGGPQQGDSMVKKNDTVADEGQPGGGGDNPDEEELQLVQTSQCSVMCKRLTHCAADSAKANEDPATVAEITKPEVMAEHTRQCQSQCSDAKLSVRQRKVMQTCVVDEASSCDDFTACLDAM